MTITKNHPASDVVMTNQALEKLTCFQDEFDDVVSVMAQTCARERTGSGKLIEITVDDVRCAAQILVQAMEDLVRAGKVPLETVEKLRLMNECAHTED